MGGVSIPAPGNSASKHRRGRGRRANKKAFGLQITSLMDVLMIVVVFLLKSYALSSMGVVQTDQLELPVSRAPDTFGEGMVLAIAQNRILLDSEPILEFTGDPKEKKFIMPDGAIDTSNQGRGILPLYDKLKKKKDDFDLLASRAQDPKAAAAKWTGDILVQADKEASYDLIRQVMYTAGMAGYKQFRLTVEKQAE